MFNKEYWKIVDETKRDWIGGLIMRSRRSFNKIKYEYL